MPRINPTITDEAKLIYTNIKNRNDRGTFVSAAIVEKHEHDTGTGLEARVEVLEKKVERLEEAKGK